MNIEFEHFQKIISYLYYFVTGIVVFCLYLKLYLNFTPYDDFLLLKKGNTSVAWVLSGTSVGLVINLAFACFYSHGFFQFLGYSFISALVQFITQFILQKTFKQLQTEIEHNNIGVGIFFGSISVCVGILNGASAY